MPSDYEAITKHNERQLGLDTASRKTQICMYSDSTHFVYEILQNADDYGATEVFFKLSKDQLLIEHNGQPFTEENVKAITYFGRSTSRDDLVKTGRFGVGFKSVFAFTATPIVISGDEHFQIYGLYRVKEHLYPDGFLRSRTRIILPFNHESEQPDYVENLISQEEAHSKISTRLTGLNMNTLLFTRNIREIRWEIDSLAGHYLREDDTKDNKYSNARWTIITDGNKLNKYLVFSRVPYWKNKEYKAVDVAFAIDEKNQLTPIDDSLYVLFATTQETHLQCILNGPYRTNPSRETISEEDHFNLHLIKETCELMNDMLLQLRELGLLTTQFLNVLPNSNDKLRNFYAPILDAIIKIFREQELVPTDDNKYATSGNVFQGPALLREVITREELTFFVDCEHACWAKGVQQNSRADYFLRLLGIQQWGWEQLQNALRKYYYYVNEPDYTWFAARSDSWLQKLYILLADAIKKGDCSAYTLKSCSIIRVRDSGKEKHVAGTTAYFPKGHLYKDLPQVKKTILIGKNEQAREKIHESLVTLGVSEIGDEERIDLLLETFYGEEPAELSTQQNLQHMMTFIKWWKKENNADKFTTYAIFLSPEGTEKLRRKKPNDCYLETPIRRTGLDVIYEDKNCKLSRKWKLWKGYREINNEDFCSFAINCGVEDALRIIHQASSHHPNRSSLQQDYLRRNTIFTSTGYDDDYIIRGLSDLLQMKNRDVNHLIWFTMSKAAPKVLEACFRPNRQYEIRRDKSSLVIDLSKAEWIPDKRGHLHKPCELTKEQLHPDFKFDNRNGWLDEIGFGESSKKASEVYKRRHEMASSLGIPVEVADYYSGLTEKEQEEELKYLKYREEARKHAQQIQRENIPYHEAIAKVFSAPGSQMSDDHEGGGGSSQNPLRRRARISENITAAIENEGKIGARFSFTMTKKWKGKNDQVREALAKWYNGQCQICGKTFTQRSGEPYFEGLYLVRFTVADWLDRVGNVLCLCAWHSAMFQYGSTEIDEDIIEQVMRFKAEAEGGDGHPMLRMKLCGEAIEIEFAENHLIDLQEMISASQSTKSSGKQ